MGHRPSQSSSLSFVYPFLLYCPFTSQSHPRYFKFLIISQFDFLLLLRCSLSSLLLSPLSLLCSLPRILLHMISLPVNFYHTITNAPPALRYASKKYIKVPRTTSKYIKVHRSISKYFKVPRRSSKYPEGPQRTLRYIKVPALMSASLFLSI